MRTPDPCILYAPHSVHFPPMLCVICSPDPCTLCVTPSLPQNVLHYALLTPYTLCFMHSRLLHSVCYSLVTHSWPLYAVFYVLLTPAFCMSCTPDSGTLYIMQSCPCTLHYTLLTPSVCMLYITKPCNLWVTHSYPCHSFNYTFLTPAFCTLHIQDPLHFINIHNDVYFILLTVLFILYKGWWLQSSHWLC